MFCDENETKFHLRIVITDPNDDGEFIAVSVVTRHKRSDAMVTLQKGDHSFINDPSVIDFWHSRVMNVGLIEGQIKSDDAKQKEKISDKIVERARMGLLESDRTENGVRDFFLSSEEEKSL